MRQNAVRARLSRVPFRAWRGVARHVPRGGPRPTRGAAPPRPGDARLARRAVRRPGGPAGGADGLRSKDGAAHRRASTRAGARAERADDRGRAGVGHRRHRRGWRRAEPGFGVWRPRIGLLSHVAAVNDVRLHIQGRSPRRRNGSPSACSPGSAARASTSPTASRSPRAAGGDRGGADGQEPASASRRSSMSSRVVLTRCCTSARPGPHRQLSELAESGRWPTLGVRELPVSRGGADERRPR